jgi:hypothetical protein
MCEACREANGFDDGESYPGEFATDQEIAEKENAKLKEALNLKIEGWNSEWDEILADKKRAEARVKILREHNSDAFNAEMEGRKYAEKRVKELEAEKVKVSKQ